MNKNHTSFQAVRFFQALLAFALLAFGFLGSMPPAPAAPVIPAVSITTFHGDNARLGWNDREAALTPTAVGSRAFGKLWGTPLGGKVTGSPLYLPQVTMGGRARHVVYAATDDNSVYALDALTGHILWARRQLTPPPRDWRNRAQMGILSTPVLDPGTQTLYACALRPRGLRQVFQMWALDLRTGATRPGWPVTLGGTDQGCRFEGGQVLQRGALTWIDGWVYAPFGARGDSPPWHGWVIGVHAASPADPQRAFCASPRADGAGIWSGGGLSADTSGALYAVTGNGDPQAEDSGGSLAQSVLRLTVRAEALTCTATPQDVYTPSNAQFLNDEDEDLGGATALVLPDQPDVKPSHLMFIGGKDGLGYLLDRDNLGGVGGEIWKQRLFSDPVAPYHEGIRSTASYFDAGPAGHWIFVVGDEPGPDGNKGISALQIVPDPVTGKARWQRRWTLTKSLKGPSSPYGSSAGATGGLVWVVEAFSGDDDDSVLHAYDALTGRELYNSDKAPVADRLTQGRRFSSPIVAEGRVFIGTAGVVCYGIKSARKGTVR